MPIDVLYILGNGSKWRNNELRYSLRSLETFGDGVGRVFLTGSDPGFLSDAVIFNKRPDPGPTESVNHIAKVLWTCQHTDISTEFLLNYDDNFFVAPVSIERYPHFYRGMLPETPDKRGSRYKKSLHEAFRVLSERGKPTKDFSVHCPVLYRRDEFIALDPLWQIARESRYGFVVRSVYCNMLEIPGVYREDLKLRSVNGKKHVVDLVRGKHMFSIADSAIRHGVASFLAEMFPRPSRYEVGTVR